VNMRMVVRTGFPYFVAALISGTLLTTDAAAQAPTSGASGWTVTPFIGVGFSGDLDSATGAVGVAGGYMWTDRLAFEAELNTLPWSEMSGVVELDSKVWSLTGNVLYRFDERNSFVPYGVFGLGFGHGSVELKTSTTSNVETSSNEFVVNFGGGIERRLRDRLALRGDLRYLFGGNLVPDYWRLSAGVTFNLGRR
jgi:opacity protein-like surface antigen